jgi:hypothetical protein
MKNYRHGMCKTTEYNQWNRILQKCYNFNDRGYYLNGGKGVTVCEEWQEFKNFLKWLKDNNKKNYDRVCLIDGRKEFSPENCVLKKVRRGDLK